MSTNKATKPVNTQLDLPRDLWMVAQQNAQNLGLHLPEYICLLIAEDDEPGLKSSITQTFRV